MTVKQSHTSFCYGPKSPKAEEANEENYRFLDNSMLIKRSLDIRGTYSLRSNQDQFQFSILVFLSANSRALSGPDLELHAVKIY